MAKKIQAVVKLNLPAGEANPGPPAGPVLGQYGVPIMDFINQYNERTKDQKGNVIPVVITIYEDRTFEFVTKLPPVSELIKKKLGLEKGSGETKRETVGKLSRQDLEEIAKEKMKDLNTNDLEAAMRIVAGTAKSMGVEVEEN
ncbi:50S ribosomal protein L11 [bacterium]|nr:50S ribosomal protein L11 [bacterium]